MTQVSDVFKDLVQRDSDICNNCFRRTHDTYERNYAIDTFRDGNETKLWAREVDLPDRSWPRIDQVTYVPGDDASEGTHLICRCGVSGDPIRPVSTDVAMKYAKRIVDRLAEKNVDFDSDTLLDTVRHKLKQPEYQGRQDEVFSDAVVQSIESWNTSGSHGRSADSSVSSV